MPTCRRPFADRAGAGSALAARLPPLEAPIILALPRGGVPVGFEVARLLGAPLDVLVARKLGAPMRPELGIGAIAEGGVRVLNHPLVQTLGVSEAQLAAVTELEEAELARRVQRYRGDRPLDPLAGRTVVLVDDGLATGVTAEAAIEAVRRAAPERLVVAVPVAAADSRRRLVDRVDDLVAVVVAEDFSSVGEWYDDFAQTPDEVVLELLERGRRQPSAGVPVKGEGSPGPGIVGLDQLMARDS